MLEMAREKGRRGEYYIILLMSWLGGSTDAFVLIPKSIYLEELCRLTLGTVPRAIPVSIYVELNRKH